MEIRKATPKDADAVRYLFRDTVTSVNAKDYSPQEVEAWMDHYKNTTMWINKIKDQHFYVAEIDKNLVGFSSLTEAGYLDFLYVHKDFQRHGVANRLLLEMINLAAGLKLPSIRVHSNRTAQPFFEKHGFIKTGNHTTKIHDIAIENAVMVKTL